MSRLQFILAFLLSCLLSCLVTTVEAQLSEGGFPQPELLPGTCLRSGNSQERVDMPAFNLDSLSRDSSQMWNGGLRFAYGFKTHLTPQNSGVTTNLRDGSQVWRLHIRSKGALSLNLIFDQFRLSEGDRLFIYSPDRGQILGSFTSKNNHDNGVLATGIIESDEVVVELTTLKSSQSELSIGEVNHGYRSLRGLPGMGVSSECNVHVSCDEDVPDDSRRSVVLIIVDGRIMCSGSLLNNTDEDGTPYLLSAAHCMQSYSGKNATSIADANQVAATSLFYFNYEAPFCKKYIQGSLEMSLSGAEVVAFTRNTDLLLLRLLERPPREYNTYYSGWNITSDVETPIYSIHHAQGEMKRFSLSYDAPVMGTFDCCSDFTFTANSHWLVTSWDRGITEAGSSGGPLFDRTGHVVGALSGGDFYEGCNTNDIKEAYYRLNRNWASRNNTNTLSASLDPSNMGTKVLDGLEPYGAPCDRLSNFTSDDNILYSEEDNYVAGNNKLGYTQYAEKFNESGQVFGVYFAAEQGKYSESDSVWIKIYDGSDHPENELYKKRVRISDVLYNNRSKSFVTTNNSSFSARDNYLHFDHPVVVKNSFFVVVEVPSNPVYPFAVYASEDKANGVNTALFKDGETWKPFTKHPLAKRPTSLWLNPLMLLSSRSNAIQLHKQTRKVVDVTPNPTEDNVSILFQTLPTAIEIYNVDGRKLDRVVPVNLQTDIQLSSYAAGLYLLKIIYANDIEFCKVIKR